MVTPVISPQGRPTLAEVTTPVGRSGTVVVVVAVVLVEVWPTSWVVPGEAEVVVSRGAEGSVEDGASGAVESTLSPPAMQAEANRESAARTGSSRRIGRECRCRL